MKKTVKICAVLAVTASLAVSMAAFAGCGDSDDSGETDITMISGDFTQEATSDQLAELMSKISLSNSANLYGDSTAEGWSYNVRLVEYGEMNIGISMSYDGGSYTLNGDMDVDFDHTISFYNNGNGMDIWGNGTMSIGYESADTIDFNIAGNTYNDAEYMYMNGTYSSTNAYINNMQLKYKMPLDEFLDEGMTGIGTFGGGVNIDTDNIAESLIGLAEIRKAMDTEGVTVYVDDSSGDTLKIKISYSKDAWFDMFFDELQTEMEEMGASGLTYSDMYDNTSFRYMDYYLEFDNDTGILLGAGSKLDATMNMSLTLEGMTISYSFDYDVDCWYMSTDTPASALPDDLDDYESLGGIIYAEEI